MSNTQVPVGTITHRIRETSGKLAPPVARVLPLPVRAWIITSRPSSRKGIARTCTGIRVFHPARLAASAICGGNWSTVIGVASRSAGAALFAASTSAGSCSVFKFFSFHILCLRHLIVQRRVLRRNMSWRVRAVMQRDDAAIQP